MYIIGLFWSPGLILVGFGLHVALPRLGEFTEGDFHLDVGVQIADGRLVMVSKAINPYRNVVIGHIGDIRRF